jgi:hypothetical protein
MNIIPLGDNCAISIILKELNKRKKAYPFDWISSVGPTPEYSSIDITIKLFIELIKTHDPNYICQKLLGNSICESNNVYNTVIFPHEHGTIDEINSKYLRRITRLHEDIINNKSNIFIIITRYYFINKEILEELCTTLNENISDYKILFISGIYHEYCKEMKNIEFTHIPYDHTTCWEWDYSHFRPQLKKYLEIYLNKQ